MQEMKNVTPPNNTLLDDRIDELEREYEVGHADPENNRKLEEVRFQLAGLLGKNDLNLLREFEDRFLAQYNTDSDWFYYKGLKDANRFSFQPGEAEKANLARYSEG